MKSSLLGLAMLSFLAACASPPPPSGPGGIARPPDLAESGGINRAFGTATGMAIGCRALSVARALTRSTGMGQLSSACSAAIRL